jgi:hypothetical protein
LAKPNLLSCLQKRDLLNRSAASADQLLKWGNLFEEEGLTNDAIDFYAKAHALEPLEKLLPLAHQEGDTFVYARIVRALGREVTAEEWISMGKRAAELGKDAFAREAFKRGGVDTVQEAETYGGPAT